MEVFGYDFKYLDDSHLEDLQSLEREQAIYSDHWIDGLNDFRHVRIKLTPAEIDEYVRSMKAFDLFLGSDRKWARDVEGIPEDIATRADTYELYLKNGAHVGPPYHCAASFMGEHLEAVVCGMDSSRSQIIEEQGIAAFLGTIRRAVDALTPAIRCFTGREKGLVDWPIEREDDVRDLLYAMLRASVSDIKREEPIPSRAGVSKVADLHSGLARTLIEVKWIGKRGQWKRVLEEIYVDIQTYGRHPNCDHLIFVIIDAVRDIPDPRLVEGELSGNQEIDEKPVSVVAYIREP